MTEEEWVNKYIVVKQGDLNRYLNRDEYQQFQKLLEIIRTGRLVQEGKYPQNYYVVNKDEPYAEAVALLIEAGWTRKQKKGLDLNKFM
jgi:hypothetical protein